MSRAKVLSETKSECELLINKHVNYLLNALNISISKDNLIAWLHSAVDLIDCTPLEPPEKTGFRFKYQEKDSVISGIVFRFCPRRYDTLKDFLDHNRINGSRTETRNDERSVFCALVVLLAIRKIGSDKGEDIHLEKIGIFTGKSFRGMVMVFAEILTETFTPEHYLSRQTDIVLKESLDVLDWLKPWGCEVLYYKTEKKYGRPYQEDYSLINAAVLKDALANRILLDGKSHPLIRLCMDSASPERQRSLLQHAMKIKTVYFQTRELADGTYAYVDGTVEIEKYVSKIISGSYHENRKKIAEKSIKNEWTVVDAENALAEYAFLRCNRKETLKTTGEIPEMKHGDFRDMFEEIGIIKKRRTEWHFSNTYMKWIYAALYLCRNYFNRGEKYCPSDDSEDRFRHYSLSENIFHCIKYYISCNSLKSNKDDALIYGTVFGTAIISLLPQEKRIEFIDYLCVLAKDFSCASRPEQELAITLLSMALNECLDSLDSTIRQKAFMRCYAKTCYRIQQESLLLLLPASNYFKEEIRRNFCAFIPEKDSEPKTNKQPYYYFYYHLLFEAEYKKVEAVLNRDWCRWSINNEEVLGIALAIRELSWQYHNDISVFSHIENINHIIKKCIPLIPLVEDVSDFAEKRRYALAVESIAYTIANLEIQLSEFIIDNEKEDIAKGCRKLLSLIFGYDLFLRMNNSVYLEYLDRPDYLNIEGVPDGLLICGMIRTFCLAQKNLPQISVDRKWQMVLEKERGRYKVLIARALSNTSFYDEFWLHSLLQEIPDALIKSDFLPYDNIDIKLIYNNPLKAREWYPKK